MKKGIGMHINDYLNQLYNNSKIGYTYYDMDVNNDYIINEKDLALAQDNNLRNAIYSLIEDVDEDSELVFNVDKDYMLTLKEEKKCNTKGLTKEDGSRGNYIIINHNVSNYYTQYMHLNAVLVKEGQTVARGQKIGTMGNTGNVYPVPSSYNPYGGTHLHFSVRRGSPYGSHINPLNLYR